MCQKKPFNPNKISSEFAARLHCLAPHQKVRVIVLLKVEVPPIAGSRPSHAERQAIMDAIRKEAMLALAYIGQIIEDFGGVQLDENPSVLGAVPVEINAAGVSALTECDAVKAVLEDQQIHEID
jgi:hypothetical protein